MIYLHIHILYLAMVKGNSSLPPKVRLPLELLLGKPAILSLFFLSFWFFSHVARFSQGKFDRIDLFSGKSVFTFNYLTLFLLAGFLFPRLVPTEFCEWLWAVFLHFSHLSPTKIMSINKTYVTFFPKNQIYSWTVSKFFFVKWKKKIHGWNIVSKH